MNKQCVRLIGAAATAWLLLPMGSAFSQSVQVKTLSADYATHQVTFSVSWAAGTRNDKHLSKVWVFIDYAAVTTNNTLDAWQRAGIAATPTTTAGTISGLTDQGFFLEGTAGAFSATVTVAIEGVPAKYSWCAHATDYPPVATMIGNTFELSGTPPFVINGTYTEPSFSYTGGLITSLTDETDCPGIIIAAIDAGAIATDGQTLCEGATFNTILETATATGGSGNFEYRWLRDGNVIEEEAAANTYYTYKPNKSGAYTREVQDAFYQTGWKASTGSWIVTVTSPGSNGQTANTCGCATGTTNCSGTCRTTGTYTTNDGACASCNVAYIRQRDQCGIVINSQYSTYSNTSCTSNCAPAGSSNWTTCGFSYITSAAYEGYMNFANANTYCQNKGMRLPNRWELMCMCKARNSTPSGYNYSNHYWSSTFGSNGHYRIAIANWTGEDDDCLEFDAGEGFNEIPEAYFRCVK